MARTKQTARICTTGYRPLHNHALPKQAQLKKPMAGKPERNAEAKARQVNDTDDDSDNSADSESHMERRIAWQTEGHPFVGRLVLRRFKHDARVLRGKITKWVPVGPGGPTVNPALWHIIYHNGHEEDLKCAAVVEEIAYAERERADSSSEEDSDDSNGTNSSTDTSLHENDDQTTGNDQCTDEQRAEDQRNTVVMECGPRQLTEDQIREAIRQRDPTLTLSRIVNGRAHWDPELDKYRPGLAVVTLTGAGAQNVLEEMTRIEFVFMAGGIVRCTRVRDADSKTTNERAKRAFYEALKRGEVIDCPCSPCLGGKGKRARAYSLGDQIICTKRQKKED